MADYLQDRLTLAVGTQYLIEAEIGRGGMSVVYRAVDLRLHRPVAIKLLPPELAFNADVRTRFLREAQTAAQLAHPNIVPIYSVDERDGLVYIVMSYVDGESLGAMLAGSARGPWPIDAAVRMLRDVADALAYAHAHGVVHRDIKPDNILMERATGRPLVTDFGIARATAGDTRLTATGAAVGTPAYMSPEQAIGEREIDGRSDIYSLGIVAYQVLAGETPFKASNTPAMLVKHVSEQPRPIREMRPDIPAHLALAVDRALAKRPEDRWASVSEFRDALAGDVRASSPPVPPPITPPWDWQRYASSGAAVSPAPRDNGWRPQLPPPGLTRKELKRWARVQARLIRAEAVRARVQGMADRQLFVGGSVHGVPLSELILRGYDARPLERRVVAFRRSVINLFVMGPTLFLINVATHGWPWFIFPVGFMFVDVLRKGGSIWSDGVGPFEAFQKGIGARLRAAAQPPVPSAPPLTLAAGVHRAGPVARAPSVPPAPPLAAADILAGAHGASVRRATSDRATIREIVASLSAVEREMIPDVTHTVDALAERVASLATTLHRLDADVSGASLGLLDERIAALKTEAATAERDRRMSLLERQRASLSDLLDRRHTLANQLESASLMLQNLKLDLLKLRSSGVGSAIEDVTSATQEARALSRDIGHILEATEDLKKL